MSGRLSSSVVAPQPPLGERTDGVPQQAPGLRRDIQGLRALAVALVVLDHARIGPFHGGYVGVDVFFVVSGFLITGLLLTEAETTGRISLLGFYARRARRILPAATVVLLSTVVASLVLLSAVQADQVVQDAVWATFFAANVKLARDGADYFHADASTSPLQHFWSLAVEEQFYVIWPLLLLVGCALVGLALRRRRGAEPDLQQRAAGIRTVATVAVLGVVGGSFAWSVVVAGRSNDAAASQAYFSPFTRAWELGVGALVACLVAHVGARPATARGARGTWATRVGGAAVGRGLAVLGWAGLVAVITASLVFGTDTAFPGYAAALPVLGTAALIISGSAVSSWGPQRLLGLAPLQRVGDWSYSIYLWHWPVLVLAAEAWRRPQGWTAAALVAGVVVLSALTYRFVEDPVRRSTMMRTRRLAPVLLYPLVVAVTLPTLAAANAVVGDEVDGGGPPITVAAYGQDGAGSASFSDNSVIALVQASIAAARNGVRIPAGLQPPLLDLETDVPDLGRCEYYLINRDHRPLCPRGDKTGSRTMVVIGDSHARQWIPALGTIAAEHGYRAYYLVREGCPAADVTPWADHGGANQECAAFQDWAREEVRIMKPALVVLASDANRRGFVADDGQRVDDTPTMTSMYRDGMDREISDLAPYAGRVTLIGDPPAVTVKPGECLSARGATLGACLSPEDPASLAFIGAEQQAAAATGAGYVDTRPWFCDDGVCPSVVGTYVPHRDRFHVSQPYAAYLAPLLGRQLFQATP